MKRSASHVRQDFLLGFMRLESIRKYTCGIRGSEHSRSSTKQRKETRTYVCVCMWGRERVNVAARIPGWLDDSNTLIARARERKKKHMWSEDPPTLCVCDTIFSFSQLQTDACCSIKLSNDISFNSFSEWDEFICQITSNGTLSLVRTTFYVMHLYLLTMSFRFHFLSLTRI